MKAIVHVAIVTLSCPNCGELLRNRAQGDYTWLLEHLRKLPQIASCRCCEVKIEIPPCPKTKDGTLRIRFRSPAQGGKEVRLNSPDQQFVDELAKEIAPEMLSNAALANLIVTAIAFGHKSALKGWTLERTIEEGKKL